MIQALDHIFPAGRAREALRAGRRAIVVVAEGRRSSRSSEMSESINVAPVYVGLGQENSRLWSAEVTLTLPEIPGRLGEPTPPRFFPRSLEGGM